VEDKKQLRQPKTLAYFFPLPYELRLPIGDNALPLHNNSNALPLHHNSNAAPGLDDNLEVWKRDPHVVHAPPYDRCWKKDD
jgi:hypothetical protein